MRLLIFNFTANDPVEKKVSDKTELYVNSEQWPEVYMGNGVDTRKRAKVKQK